MPHPLPISTSPLAGEAEWLEADGLGGFASGTVSGPRTRRYHAVLLCATRPPTSRMVLVNGFDAHVESAGIRHDLTSQRYLPDTLHPALGRVLAGFDTDPWPRWTFRLDDETTVVHEILAVHGSPLVVLAWRFEGPEPQTLVVRPFLSGRDYHALHHENAEFRFEADGEAGRVSWTPYASVPTIGALSSGTYHHQPYWYRNFLYTVERERGLDCAEDLGSPGEFHFKSRAGEALLLLGVGAFPDQDARSLAGELREKERARRASFSSPLHRSADAYVVSRGRGKTVIAGYPWFTDWGRDTFLSLRGLCLATGRSDEARGILGEWAASVDAGMLPNRFPDGDSAPEYNSVDASLLFVIAVHELLARTRTPPEDEERLRSAVLAIVSGYRAGTRHGIHATSDGLLAAGEPGFQLTWMDAKVGDFVVTPRMGKPVEVQALWLNALEIAARWDPGLLENLERGRRSFLQKFWNAERACLYDVVDCDGQEGAVDGTLRPNQILAVGGLPFQLLEGERAQSVVAVVERELVTPLGLRTLGRGEPGYSPRYEGGPEERDRAYHQGTAWPWLLGPFVEAWVRVRGSTPEALAEARRLFLEPLLRHVHEAGLGHLSEIADGDPPHNPRGCPFQAWSLGEALRLDLEVLRPPAEGAARVP